MKRILAAVFLSAMALQAGAQDWRDALNISENDYLGTARSVGMGNAMTAVGGDLGSLTFNPAGSHHPGAQHFHGDRSGHPVGWFPGQDPYPQQPDGHAQLRCDDGL